MEQREFETHLIERCMVGRLPLLAAKELLKPTDDVLLMLIGIFTHSYTRTMMLQLQ